MMVETRKFDMANYLDSPEAIATYLDVVLEEDDPAAFRQALGTVARAVGMSKMAEDAGISRQALYKALSEAGNPSMETVTSVLKPLGLRFTVLPAGQRHARDVLEERRAELEAMIDAKGRITDAGVDVTDDRKAVYRAQKEEIDRLIGSIAA